METRAFVRRTLLSVVCAAAAIAIALPAPATAQEAPPPPAILSPRPSALVKSKFVITGRVAASVTGLSVGGASASTVTVLAADSEGATFTVEVAVTYGRHVIALSATSDGATWSQPATIAVWNLGAVKRDVRLVLVDKSDFMLYVIRWNAVVAAYPIAIGMRGTPTPTGTRYLARPSASPSSVWGPFRMRLYRKAWVRVAYRVRVSGRLRTRYRKVLKLVGTPYYIHGTNDRDSIGTPASHGCVRLWNKNLRVFRGLTYKCQLTILRP